MFVTAFVQLVNSSIRPSRNLSYLIGIGPWKDQIRYHGNTIGVFVSLVVRRKKNDVEYVKTHFSNKKDVTDLESTSQLEILEIGGRAPTESKWPGQLHWHEQSMSYSDRKHDQYCTDHLLFIFSVSRFAEKGKKIQSLLKIFIRCISFT